MQNLVGENCYQCTTSALTPPQKDSGPYATLSKETNLPMQSIETKPSGVSKEDDDSYARITFYKYDTIADKQDESASVPPFLRRNLSCFFGSCIVSSILLTLSIALLLAYLIFFHSSSVGNDKKLFSNITLMHQLVESDDFQYSINLNITCTEVYEPDIVRYQSFHPQCCSFPYTYQKQLYYRCTAAANGILGCFVDHRIWVTCTEPTDFVARNRTVTEEIPFVVRYTAILVHRWIVFQQRIDRSVNFNRSWEDYKAGFGRPDGNFWMGLEKIHQLTSRAPYSLRFEFLLRNGTWTSSEYDNFTVSDEAAKYKIQVSGYSGDAGDVMTASHVKKYQVHNGMMFSTFDSDNDDRSFLLGNCASIYGGGWWYKNCFSIGVNHPYDSGNFNVYNPDEYEYLNLTITRLMMKPRYI